MAWSGELRREDEVGGEECNPGITRKIVGTSGRSRDDVLPVDGPLAQGKI
jgi:hypothetical protein